MKHLPVLLLCCLLLTGCGRQPEAVQDQLIPEIAALYDAGSPMEQKTHGAVRTYPLPMADAWGIWALGADPVIFSGEDSTVLTLLRGADLYPAASYQLDFRLDTEDPSVHPCGSGLSFYDHLRGETVVLDQSLTEVRRIAAPRDMTGSPILSRDGKTLYYCTANAVRAWDLETGLRRLVRAVSAPDQTVTGLHMDDQVLQCTSGGSTLLIDLQEGRLLHRSSDPLSLTTRAGRWYASVPAGLNTLLLFGSRDEAPWSLSGADYAAEACFFLENRNGAVALSQGPVLSYYDLASGRRSSILPLTADGPAAVEDTVDGQLYVLARDSHYDGPVLYRWDVEALPAGDQEVYTFPHFTAREPDLEGLARCRAEAQALGSRFGLNILIGEEAAETQPWDYDFTPELLVPLIRQELKLLEDCLSRYPKSVLEDTAAHFSSLTICLVREITGTAESGSLEEANGLQFFDGSDAYLVLAMGPNSDHPLYHELFHVMETHLLGGSAVFDRWEDCNPPGFTYLYGEEYREALDRLIQGRDRAFIDRYSTSFPKEDRARIMEYAMTPGNGYLFESSILQAKLNAICTAIRQAYGLENSPEVFPWEQYLAPPAASEG